MSLCRSYEVSLWEEAMPSTRLARLVWVFCCVDASRMGRDHSNTHFTYLRKRSEHENQDSRSSQAVSIPQRSVCIGFFTCDGEHRSAQTLWTGAPSPTPTNNIYYNAGNVA